MKLTSLCFTVLLTSIFVICFIYSSVGQVGIGTTSPNADALLEIGDATTNTKGMLLPRVDLQATTNPSPLSTNVPGMIVYNKNTAGDVTPGFYYNDGSNWVRIRSGSAENEWSTTGNSGTSTSTHYIGTADNVGLLFKTAATNAFEISGGNATNRGKLRAHSNGTAALPVYSWNNDTDLGMYRTAANSLGFSTGGTNRFLLGATESVLNEDGNDYDFRIESDTQTNMFFVDSGNSRIGIQNNSPSHQFHMTNGGLDVGATAMAVFYNHGANGVGLSGYNTGLTNGYSGVEGDTDGTGSAIRGIHLPSTGAGVGVYGASNSSQSSGGWAGYFSGAMLVTGGYYAPSETKWKKEITDLKLNGNILEKINKLKVKTYKWNVDDYPGMNFNPEETTFGFMAQELKEVFPELVISNRAIPDPTAINEAHLEITMVSGYHLVNYTGLIPILTKAIQEQNDIIQFQNKKIEMLENSFNTLQQDIKILQEKKQ
jgi:hypothetical protein